jgi:hypothetical protein
MLTTDRFNSSERTYKSYTLLLRLVPRLKEMLDDSSVDTDTFDHFVAQVRCNPAYVFYLDIPPSFKRVQMMHAVMMSGV